MTTKQRSKPVIIKNKNGQKRSPIEKELLECCKNHQPVLLYGKDTHGRGDLIKRIQLNGGKDTCFEYEGYEKYNIRSVDIHDSMTKALEEQDTEKAKDFLRFCKDTNKTWRSVDCDFKSGKEVYDILLNKFELFSGGFGGRGLLVTKEKIKIRELYKEHMDSLTRWNPFLFCHGLLFVDNLKCARYDSKDEEWYSRLAKRIEYRKKIDREETDRGSGDWLVAYAHDCTTFPGYFKEQFKLVSLDKEVKEKKVEGFRAGIQTNEDGKRASSWSDINMVVNDSDYNALDISIKGGKPYTVSCREMGLESAHTHKPRKAWWVLMVFAKAENNEIPTIGKELTEFAKLFSLIPGDGGNLWFHIDTLRKNLIEHFGIAENPIPHSEDAKSYTTLFRIKDSPYAEEHKKSTEKRENVKCDGCGKLIKTPTYDNVDERGYNVCDTCLGKNVNRDEYLGEKYANADDTDDEWN